MIRCCFRPRFLNNANRLSWLLLRCLIWLNLLLNSCISTIRAQRHLMLFKELQKLFLLLILLFRYLLQFIVATIVISDRNLDMNIVVVRCLAFNFSILLRNDTSGSITARACLSDRWWLQLRELLIITLWFSCLLVGGYRPEITLMFLDGRTTMLWVTGMSGLTIKNYFRVVWREVKRFIIS